MREKGKAMMGRGEASGEKRVLAAAVAAISNPLIENPSIKRASGLIISITGGKDLMLYEVDEAATRIRDEADPDANIIVGASFDESLEGIVRVSVVATGIDNVDPALLARPAETPLTQLAGRLRDDSRRIADRIERSAPLPQVESPPLRPQPHNPVRPPARPHQDYARQAAPQPLDPYGRTSPRNIADEDLLDIPAFLRRSAN
jgi:cell division protein FtsZ